MRATRITGTSKKTAEKRTSGLIRKANCCPSFYKSVHENHCEVSMATPRNTDTTQKKNGDFGLLAFGSCGPWEIAIDEHISDADRWCAQVEGPSVTFYFEIPSLEIVRQMRQLLDRSAVSSERDGSLLIGKEPGTPVTLVRDNEYGDRFFLLVGPTANPIVSFAIAGADVVNIVEALRQVSDDIDDEG
jgi:hypothetical protein